MARVRKTTAFAFDAISVEGILLTPAMLGEIYAGKAREQAEADYSVPRGLTIRDEIARYFRIGQALFNDLHAGEAPSQAATERFARNFLRQVLGFDEIDVTGQPGLHLGQGGRVPVVVVRPGEALDRPSAVLSIERRRSAASTLQDWLNAHDEALWGLALNGERLRLMRDNDSLTRPTWIEANLVQMFRTEAFADFTLLWLLVHATRFGRAGAPVADCPLERWREDGQKAGIAARKRLAAGFEEALEALGTGFLAHPENRDLRERLSSGRLPLQDYFGQLLRLAYRLIFLFATEDRNLLHTSDPTDPARKLYEDGYSTRALRDASARRSTWDRHGDRWEGLKIVFRALARGEPRLNLPALDGLFKHGTLGELEGATLANRHLMQAVWSLGWLREDGRPFPINWKDMETEELGSVYEGLLELTPRLTEDGRAMTFAEGAETKGNERKTSGSYYTPDSLVQLLLDSTLDPVLDRAETSADPAQGLLGVTVIDPACGSGHFLLGAARRIATRLARARGEGGLASAEDYRHALRDVVKSCIHGVDRNPMAVELAKVALWIESVDPGRPLGFLDANIRCGDSLLGVFDLKVLDEGIPDAAYKPLSGDDKDAARIAGRVNRQQKDQAKQRDLLARLSGEGLARETRRVLALPEDDVADVQQKAEAWRRLRAEAGWGSRKLACDLYIAAFLRKKTFRADGLARAQTPDRVPTTLDVRTAISGGQPDPHTAALAVDLAAEARAFHWALEFPAEMAAGGFDVVLGNPPWERVKLQEKEYFAAHSPEIAKANAAARFRMISALAASAEGSRERIIYEGFGEAKRAAEATSAFARVSAEEQGRFPLTGRGDVNTYALFSELAANLVSPHGRAGIIVPTGLAMNETTSEFFWSLLSSGRVHCLLAMDEIKNWFQGTADNQSFCLLTLSYGNKLSRFAFRLSQVLDATDVRRNFMLSPGDVSALNPNTRTISMFRAKEDARIVAKIYERVPILNHCKAGSRNSWSLSFMTMFHMSGDSELFMGGKELEELGCVKSGHDWVSPDGSERWIRLFEAKMIHHFDHRFGYYPFGHVEDTRALPRPNNDEKNDPEFEVSPRYWVSQREVNQRLVYRGSREWFMGWRDITATTNERTVIPALFPRVAAGHVLPLMFSPLPAMQLCGLLANLSSLVLDYVARQKLGGTHLTYGYLNQLPILTPEFYGVAETEFLSSRVLELSFTSEALRPFARDLGWSGPPFGWDEDRRALLRADLDAFYAHAYGLTRDELRYILDPKEVMGEDYPSETFRVLKDNEIRKYGEYRTRRLVIEAWDRLYGEDANSETVAA